MQGVPQKNFNFLFSSSENIFEIPVKQ